MEFEDSTQTSREGAGLEKMVNLQKQLQIVQTIDNREWLTNVKNCSEALFKDLKIHPSSQGSRQLEAKHLLSSMSKFVFDDVISLCVYK